MNKKRVVIVFLSALLVLSVLEIFTPLNLIGRVIGAGGYTPAQFGHNSDQINFANPISQDVTIKNPSVHAQLTIDAVSNATYKGDSQINFNNHDATSDSARWQMYNSGGSLPSNNNFVLRSVNGAVYTNGLVIDYGTGKVYVNKICFGSGFTDCYP